MAQNYKYRAFITYSHRDKKWGDWLHYALETYSMPRQVRGANGRDGPVPARLYPIFRDREELPTAADLSEQISQALNQSACLIVICSPHSATSRWVNEEILTFKRMGRESRILAIIVDGEPNAADKTGFDAALECFPPALKFRLGQNGQLTDQHVEPIAADARPQGDGKTNALLKVIAGALGIGYDALKRREERRQAFRRTTIAAVGSAALGAAALFAWQNFDQGKLEADALPQTTVIAVDGAEVGARIRNLKLRSGAHELYSFAPNFHDTLRTVQVPRRGSIKTNVWLDKALDWEYANSGIQSGIVIFPSGDDMILAHNELNRIVLLSMKTGKPVDSVPLEEGNRRTFKGLDIGKDVGIAIIAAIDRQHSGIDIQAVATELPARTLWNWQGPPSGFNTTENASVVALAATGRPATVAIGGRDGAVHFLDGSSGEKLGETRLAPSVIPMPPVLTAGNTAAGPALAAFFWTSGESQAPAAQGREGKPMVGAGIDAALRTITWRREYGAAWQGPSAEFTVAGTPHIALWNDREWQVIDIATGQTRSRGDLKGRLYLGPAFFEMADNSGTALVFQYKDPALPMAAVRASDGSALWQGPDRLRSDFQPRDADGVRMLRTTPGLLVINREKAVAAVDPATGKVAWEIDAEPIGDTAMTGDWDGDGRLEIFMTMRGGVLVCLDGTDGHRIWSARLANALLTPWRTIKSSTGGASSDLLLHTHASMIARVHGPHVLWQQSAFSPIRATPIAANLPDGRSIVIATGAWGKGEDVRAFDAATGTELWTLRDQIIQNLPPALVDMKGDGVKELLAFGALENDPSTQYLLSYRVSDGTRTRAVAVDFKGWSATPVVADFRGIGKNDVAFSTWTDKSIMMVDGQTGATLWRFPTNGENMGGVIAGDLDGDGHPDVVALSGDGHLYGLRGLDGQLIWKVETEPGFAGNGLARPTLAAIGNDAKPQVLAISGQGRLLVADASTGKVTWRSKVAGGPGGTGSPVVVESDGRTIILAPQRRAGLIAYDAATHAELWRSPAEHPMLSSPLVMSYNGKSGSAVFAVSSTGLAYLIDISSGRIIWQDRISDGGVEADPVQIDVNKDGVPDIVIAGRDMKLTVLNGRGKFGATLQFRNQ